jgi:signal peptidase II
MIRPYTRDNPKNIAYKHNCQNKITRIIFHLSCIFLSMLASSITSYFKWLMTSDKSLLIATAIFVDQLTKYVFYDHHRLSNRILLTPIFNHWVTWWYLLHKGVILAISFWALIVFYHLYRIRYISKIVYVFLMAGTLWNLLDRIVLWGVRDFIDFQFFPIFNIADIYLTLAVVLITYGQYILFRNHSKQS